MWEHQFPTAQPMNGIAVWQVPAHIVEPTSPPTVLTRSRYPDVVVLTPVTSTASSVPPTLHNVESWKNKTTCGTSQLKSTCFMSDYNTKGTASVSVLNLRFVFWTPVTACTNNPGMWTIDLVQISSGFASLDLLHLRRFICSSLHPHPTEEDRRHRRCSVPGSCGECVPQTVLARPS